MKPPVSVGGNNTIKKEHMVATIVYILFSLSVADQAESNTVTVEREL